MAGPRRSRERQPLGCHDRALLLLAARARSRHELASRLRRAGFDADEVEAEMLRLEGVGLIDDEAFARELARHHIAVRKSGRRAVVDALRAKGVETLTIERTLAELGVEGGDEQERASGLAAERARRLSMLPPEVAYARIVSLLLRRGYEGATARAAAGAALRIDAEQG